MAHWNWFLDGIKLLYKINWQFDVCECECFKVNLCTRWMNINDNECATIQLINHGKQWICKSHFCAKKNEEKQEEAAAGVFALNEDEKRKIKIF